MSPLQRQFRIEAARLQTFRSMRVATSIATLGMLHNRKVRLDAIDEQAVNETLLEFTP